MKFSKSGIAAMALFSLAACGQFVPSDEGSCKVDLDAKTVELVDADTQEVVAQGNITKVNYSTGLTPQPTCAFGTVSWPDGLDRTVKVEMGNGGSCTVYNGTTKLEGGTIFHLNSPGQ